MIDRETIDKILDATNIVDVVSEFVTLRKSGVNYKGLCPFHDDKTPSFMVSPTKQICKCFSCGEGGTAINFLMKHEQITYPEALRWLAKKYNIEIVIDEAGLDDAIGVELVTLVTDKDGQDHVYHVDSFDMVERNGNNYTFRATHCIDNAGSFKVCYRMFPKNENLPHRQDFCYVKWFL